MVDSALSIALCVVEESEEAARVEGVMLIEVGIGSALEMIDVGEMIGDD